MTRNLSQQEVNTTSHGTGTEPPRFRKVAEHIRALISSGELPEHSALPSERSIAEQHGISRMTARRALEALETEGLVYSENRRGRFVSPQRLTYDVTKMVSFAADAEARGIELEIDVIDAQETVADAELARDLAVPKGEPLFEYTRLFRSNGHPVFIEKEFATARRFPGFLSRDLARSTTLLMETDYGVSAHAGDIVIRMRGMQPWEAQLLCLSPSLAGVELVQVVYDDKGVPFCVGRQLWRGELAEFSARAMPYPKGNG